MDHLTDVCFAQSRIGHLPEEGLETIFILETKMCHKIESSK